jgi:hypothetical protein
LVSLIFTLCAAASAIGDDACGPMTYQSPESGPQLNLPTTLKELARELTEKILTDKSFREQVVYEPNPKLIQETTEAAQGIAIRIFMQSEALSGAGARQWVRFELRISRPKLPLAGQGTFTIGITDFVQRKRSYFYEFSQSVFGGSLMDMDMDAPVDAREKERVLTLMYSAAAGGDDLNTGAAIPFEQMLQTLKQRVMQKKDTTNIIGLAVAEEDQFWGKPDLVAAEAKWQECEAAGTCDTDDHLKFIRDTVEKDEAQYRRIKLIANFYMDVIGEACNGLLSVRLACACFGRDFDKFQNSYYYVLKAMAAGDGTPEKDYQKRLRNFAQFTCDPYQAERCPF